MREILIVGVILLFSIASCKKPNNEPSLFSGIVQNAENGAPMPDAMTKLYFSSIAPNFSVMLIDSTNTNDEGSYRFSRDVDQFIYYSTDASKNGYVRKGYDRIRRTNRIGKTIAPKLVNTDTILLGRVAILKLNLNIVDEMGSYVIYCDEFPISLDTNTSLNDIPVVYRIEPDFDQPLTIVERYLYIDNQKVPVSWFRKDVDGDTTVVWLNMIPQDTVHLSLDMK